MRVAAFFNTQNRSQNPGSAIYHEDSVPDWNSEIAVWLRTMGCIIFVIIASSSPCYRSCGLWSIALGKNNWGKIKVNTAAGRWMHENLQKGQVVGMTLKGLLSTMGMVGSMALF